MTENENEVPVDFYSSFIKLGNKKYLSVKLSKSLASSAGLRNRLAHEYDELDPKKVYEAMNSCIKDVPKYLKSLVKSLKL